MGLESTGANAAQVLAMTIITPIKDGRLDALKQILAQPPGPVVGRIATIHYARWVIINDDSNLLFASEFDGSWEDYLRDFSRETPDGLDAIWGNCVGYPAGGAADFDAFKAYVRAHQLPDGMFYAAYPDLTVKSILKHRRAYALGLELLNEFG